MRIGVIDKELLHTFLKKKNKEQNQNDRRIGSFESAPPLLIKRWWALLYSPQKEISGKGRNGPKENYLEVDCW
jgi:hypothetical protein